MTSSVNPYGDGTAVKADREAPRATIRGEEGGVIQTLWHIALAIAAILPCAGAPSRSRPAFDATFVQIRHEQLDYGEVRWRQELELLRGLGVKLVIVQVTGDTGGAYDRDGRAPVAGLLAAATYARYSRAARAVTTDPTWPSDAAVTRLPPPLADAVATKALGELCRRSPVCDGWYVSQEIDDATWASAPRTAALRRHVAGTARALRELVPGKRIALGPVLLRCVGAEAACALVARRARSGRDRCVDAARRRRYRPCDTRAAGAYLAELRVRSRRSASTLWSVAELFHKRHGAPSTNDRSRRFRSIRRLQQSLAVERPLVDARRRVCGARLHEPEAQRSELGRLYRDYATRCRAALNAEDIVLKRSCSCWLFLPCSPRRAMGLRRGAPDGRRVDADSRPRSKRCGIRSRRHGSPRQGNRR
jgi:hypothetical protein